MNTTMNTNTLGRKAILGSLALGIACIFALGTGNASASEHGGRSDRRGSGVSINIGNGGGYSHDYHNYGPSRYGSGYGFGFRSWYGGHYDGGYSNRYITSYDYYTPAPSVWVDGYYENQYYGNRYVRVWHPGCYRN